MEGVSDLSPAELRLAEVVETSGRLRRDLALIPMQGTAAVTFVGAVLPPGIRFFDSGISAYLSPMLLTASITNLVCLHQARKGSEVAPQIGAASLLVTSAFAALLSPAALGMPITAIAYGHVILSGTLTHTTNSARWFWMSTVAWVSVLMTFDALPYRMELAIFPTTFFAIITYLTQRVSLGLRQNQKEAIEALEELTKVNHQLAEEREAAHQASRAKSSFLANMSHELRTPLNAIIGYGELVLEAPEEFEINDIERVVGSGRHLLAIVNDILDMSRIEAGHLHLVEEDVDLVGVLDDLKGMAEALVTSGVTLNWQLGDLGVIRADSKRIRQILVNLMGNALKFTQAGSITVRANCSETLDLQLTDTGIGIPDSVLPMLFLPFSQGSSSGLKHQGTGLGLAITQSLVESMGGSLSLTSREGVGTQVRVSLPIRPIE